MSGATSRSSLRRRGRLLLGLLAALSLVATATASAAPAGPGPGGPPQRAIVVLDDAASPIEVAAELGRVFGAPPPSHVYEHALRGFSAALPPAALTALARDPRVVSVELDQEVRALDQTMPTGVRRVRGDGNPTAGIGTGNAVDVDVAVLDTGIATHSDLDVHRRVDCLTTTGGGPPWSRTHVCTENSGNDGDGHGTHVAGTAAARDNDAGVVGVAPGARLWAIKVLDDNGSGSIAGIVAGIDYLTANATQVEVANMSLGCECSSSALTTALDNSTAAGIVYVAAAGNSDSNAATFAPANHARVLSVGALADFDGEPGGLASPTCRQDQDDTRANFSNYGSSVDLAAPGVCILSTVPGGYATFSGTSMAAPHVAGAAALYIVANDVPRSADRWSVVRSGLQGDGWSVAPGDECGYTPTPGKSIGRLLVVAACDGSEPDPDPEPEPEPDPEPEPEPDPEPDPDEVAVSLAGHSVNNGATWTAVVDITVTAGGSPAGDTSVSGTWSSGGGAGCQTSSAGTCSVSLGGILKRVDSVTYTVTSVDGEGVSGPSTSVSK